MGKELLERFTKKNYKRQIKQSLKWKKKSWEKVINYMPNGKVLIICLKVGLLKKILLYKMSCFSETCSCNKKKIKVELYLFNYATKSGLKNATGVEILKFGKKFDLAN